MSPLDPAAQAETSGFQEVSVSGPSFPRLFKLLAWLLLGGLLALAGQAWDALVAQAWPADPVLLGSVCAVLVAWGVAHILLSRTGLERGRLWQGWWLWHQSVALSDITQVRLLRIAALDAVFAPRLSVKAKGHLGTLRFYAADARVLGWLQALAHGTPPPSDAPASLT